MPPDAAASVRKRVHEERDLSVSSDACKKPKREREDGLYRGSVHL